MRAVTFLGPCNIRDVPFSRENSEVGMVSVVILVEVEVVRGGRGRGVAHEIRIHIHYLRAERARKTWQKFLSSVNKKCLCNKTGSLDRECERSGGDKCGGIEKFKQNVLIKFNGRLKITLSVDGGLFSRSGLGTVI